MADDRVLQNRRARRRRGTSLDQRLRCIPTIRTPNDGTAAEHQSSAVVRDDRSLVEEKRRISDVHDAGEFVVNRGIGRSRVFNERAVHDCEKAEAVPDHKAAASITLEGRFGQGDRACVEVRTDRTDRRADVADEMALGDIETASLTLRPHRQK